jgi:hypothetical protein
MIYHKCVQKMTPLRLQNETSNFLLIIDYANNTNNSKQDL